MSRYALGIGMLVVSLLLSGILGILQEKTYKKYGPCWKEGVFYTHFLSLPVFLFLIPDVKQGLASLSENKTSSLFAWLILGGNLITQLICVSGVNRLTSGHAMPSFLSKVFSPRKKHDKDHPEASKRQSDPSLLEGRFERVSPNVSPVADNFSSDLTGNGREQDKDGKREKDKGGKAKEAFSLLRTKSSASHEDSTTSETPASSRDYCLSLNLSVPKNGSGVRPLGVVFEGDADSEGLLSDAAIGRRRLSPQETLVLVRACSQEIMARGLTTLGVMHPHWHSASPETQRRLITLFLQSLAANGPSNTLSTDTSTPSSSNFESEISSGHSPHDVAAVLRWGVRHLQLEGSSFGREQEWYRTFFDAERSASYPPKAFSDKLVPLLPKSHLELLNVTISVLSAFAANAEANGMSGSKLSMLLGLLLLSSQRSESGDDWQTFYNRWERNGRILEHLFLSQLREEGASQPLPKRLAELVKHYPYSSSPSADAGLLPRPRFSTSRYDALFIHIDSDLPSRGLPPKSFIKLVEAALRADYTAGNTENKSFWEQLRQASSSEGDTIDIYKILADDTIQLFSLYEPATARSPTFKIDIPNGFTRRRSLSLNGGDQQRPSAPPARDRQQSASSGDDLPTTAPNNIGMDWSQFSNSGFLESGALQMSLAQTLLDKDLEVTQPPSRAPSGRKTPTRKSSERRPGRGRKSLDALPPITIPDSSALAEESEAVNEGPTASRITQASLIKLDEAFIDFWADSLMDPISESWPRFAICRLTHLPGLEVEVAGKPAKPLEWLVVDQKFVKPAPVSTVPTATERTPATSTGPSSPTEEAPARPRPTSPKPSLKSFGSSARKRFTFWSSSDKDKEEGDKEKGKSKKKGSPKIGEMGEILEDNSAPKDKVFEKAKPEEKAAKKEATEKEEAKGSDVLAGAGVFATGVVAAGVAAGVTSGIVEEDEDKKDAGVSDGAKVADAEPAQVPVGATSEPKEEVKAQDETKFEEKLPVSESALTAGVVSAAAAAGLTGVAAEDAKKDEEPAVTEASPVDPVDTVATPQVLAHVADPEPAKDVAEAPAPVQPIAAQEPSAALPEAAKEVSPPTQAATAEEVAVPVEATEASTHVDAPAESEPLSEVVAPIVSEPVNEVPPPIDNAAATEEVAQPPVETNVHAEAEPEPPVHVAAAVVPEPVEAAKEVSPPAAEEVEESNTVAEEPVQAPAPVDPKVAPPVETTATEVDEPVEAAEEVEPPVEVAPPVDVAAPAEASTVEEPVEPVEAADHVEPASSPAHEDTQPPVEAEPLHATEEPAQVSAVDQQPATSASAIVETRNEQTSVPVEESEVAEPEAPAETEVVSEQPPTEEADPEPPVVPPGLQEETVEPVQEHVDEAPSSAVADAPPAVEELNNGTAHHIEGEQKAEDDAVVPAEPEPASSEVAPGTNESAVEEVVPPAEAPVEAEQEVEADAVPTQEHEREAEAAVEQVPVAAAEEVAETQDAVEPPVEEAQNTAEETVEADKAEEEEAELSSVPVVVEDEAAGPSEEAVGQAEAEVETSPIAEEESQPVVEEKEAIQEAEAEAPEAPVAAEEVPLSGESDKVETVSESVPPPAQTLEEAAGQTKEDEMHFHTEPLHDTSAEAGDDAVTLPPVPLVEAEIIPPAEPTALPDHPVQESAVPPADPGSATEESLPPAPASVVLSGDTPGPEIALSSSEPAAQKAASESGEEEAAKEADADVELNPKDTEKSEHDAPTHTQEPQDA
ncbi:hypothetical protein V5O48_015574, partial [Marasmius crinis-equi]